MSCSCSPFRWPCSRSASRGCSRRTPCERRRTSAWRPWPASPSCRTARSEPRNPEPDTLEGLRSLPSADALEDDHGDLPLGLLLVLGEARGDLRLPAPQPVSLVALGDPGLHLDGLGPNLDG